jgi:hypothetical protein
MKKKKKLRKKLLRQINSHLSKKSPGLILSLIESRALALVQLAQAADGPQDN